MIVGSRLVRAAAEAAEAGEDPAAAVGELVAALADGAPALGFRAVMGVLLTLIAGLVVWVVLWAIGAKAFDAFLHHARDARDRRGRATCWSSPYLPGNRRRSG